MKFFVLFIGLFITNPTTMVDINQVRNSYRYAKDSKDNTEKFFELTQKTDYEEDPVLAAYYGCSLTLKAFYADRTGDKISFFKQGKKMIEAAAISDPNNIEIRMIRLSVQSTAPRITRYYKNIDADKNYIIQHIDNVSSPKLKDFIKGFMSESEVFTE